MLLLLGIRALVWVCAILCLLEMATGFSVFRGSYKITYLWNQAEPAVTGHESFEISRLIISYKLQGLCHVLLLSFRFFSRLYNLNLLLI